MTTNANEFQPESESTVFQELPPDWHTAAAFSDEDYAAIYAADLERGFEENAVPNFDSSSDLSQDWEQGNFADEQNIHVLKQTPNPITIALPNPTLNPPTNPLTQQFLTLIEYLYTRQTLKNSLSKKNNSTDIPTEKQKILTLFSQLTEQLSEGHTILLATQFGMADYQRWQVMGWVTILPVISHKNITNNNTTYQHRYRIQTPLVIKILTHQEQCRAVVWLHRQWFAERQLAQQLMTLATRPIPSLSLSLNATTIQPNAQQQLAIEKASQNALCIITGGPGTGKTFTVAQLVIAMHASYSQEKKDNPFLPPLSITLTAPTGKAAQRMQESLSRVLSQNLNQNSPSQSDELIAIDNAKTLHRLLGIGSNGVPRYHKDNPLPDDLIIVDEASMLGLELAGLLVDAIKPTARLIMLGDANQLAAVDAGAVLSDLCLVPALQPYRVALTQSQRFSENSAIGQLALAITQSATHEAEQRQKITKTLALLPKYALPSSQKTKTTISNLADIRFFPIYKNTDLRQVYDELANLYQPFFALMQAWQTITPDIYDQTIRDELFAIFDKFRVLSAGHHGNLGVKMINQMLSKTLKKQLKLPFSDSHFFHGQPIIMLKNDYQLGLFNGDIGICVQQASRDKENTLMGEMLACFPDKVVAMNRISQDSCDMAFAFTIHKSQGSEFEHVAMCLDIVHTRLLSQELIYTAVTRSKQQLTIFSPEHTLTTAILQKGNRQTGLVLQFE